MDQAHSYLLHLQGSLEKEDLAAYQELGARTVAVASAEVLLIRAAFSFLQPYS